MKTALITGASAGIGAAFARRLAAEGYDLVLVARDEQRLQTLATDLIDAAGISVEVLAADLSVQEDIHRVAKRAGSQESPIDLVINNAGFGVKTAFLETPLEVEENLLTVMVHAVMVICHEAALAMRSRGEGTIINVSSVASLLTSGTYSSAKSYVTVLSESLAAQLAGTGVHVMALIPGFTNTEFHQRGEIDVAHPENSRLETLMWLDSDRLVDDCLRDMRSGKVLSIPSWQYRSIFRLLRHMPRSILRGSVARGMHRPGAQEAK